QYDARASRQRLPQLGGRVARFHQDDALKPSGGAVSGNRAAGVARRDADHARRTRVLRQRRNHRSSAILERARRIQAPILEKEMPYAKELVNPMRAQQRGIAFAEIWQGMLNGQQRAITVDASPRRNSGKLAHHIIRVFRLQDAAALWTVP